MNSHWKIFTNAEDFKKAGKVLKWVLDQIGSEYDLPNIEEYHKGGFVCSFKIEEVSTEWERVVFSTIEKAQLIGRSWSLNGDIDSELDLWSSESTISGVSNMQVSICKNA